MLEIDDKKESIFVEDLFHFRGSRFPACLTIEAN